MPLNLKQTLITVFSFKKWCIYTYDTCHPDIGYAITTISKFSTIFSALHYSYLKLIVKYLCLTKDLGIRFKQMSICPEVDVYRNNVTLDKTSLISLLIWHNLHYLLLLMYSSPRKWSSESNAPLLVLYLLTVVRVLLLYTAYKH